MTFGKHAWTAAAVATAAVAGLVLWSSLAATSSVLLPARLPDDAAERGAVYFYAEDFGGLSAHSLETHALPWRLSAAALVVEARRRQPDLPLSRATLDDELARFGFLHPQSLGNWPGRKALVASALPLGMTYGEVQILPGVPVTVSNLGCASCHAGATYDKRGRPVPQTAWLGAPNTSLNLELYTSAVYDAYVASVDDPDALMAAVRILFPEMSVRERWALRNLVLPRVRDRLKDLKAEGRALPFPNGSPGATNGVAALKLALDVPMDGGGKSEYGVTSIPDLGLRTFRTSLLYDGAYAPAGTKARMMGTRDITPQHVKSLATITTFFSVPSMGISPKRASGNIRKADDIYAFLGSYRPQPFPGTADERAAARGSEVYRQACAACHGSYDDSGATPRLVSFPNWAGDVGTDPARARAFSPELSRAVNATAYGKPMTASATGLYAAPPLSGLWATAPYLHNGSVPSLAALLGLAPRPGRFMVGGHRLNFDTVGIDLTANGSYPAGYVPWSQPWVLETSAPGYGSGGHDFGAELKPAQKRDLIAYLKKL
ncbi:uncharacterized protein y4iJ [Asticcacaulis biprosthecium C19]|uniref:Uncharacterized protein y4iJ n=1 Tax=Asticcacaulis biprosthecium C19 TaxID=715226 RepID=F4QNS6_9CAUL|nr:c-type cytochrome [Asticcacaulis biprosthecium]EGF90984.1 uncharacterized protein y4iJ [Asticcacaulis biprosthecium C19]